MVAATVITALAHTSPVLGNVRSVVREDGVVVESNEYYPYGGLFSATPSVQPYKYGTQPLARRSGRCNVGRMPVANTKTTFGNELDRTHGLDWYDSKARFYDPLLGRANSMDKKAGDYTWLSPYCWCAANPIRFTDPDGMALWQFNENGELVKYDSSYEKDRFEIVDKENNILLDKNGKEIFIEFNNGTVTKYRHINDGNNGYEIFDVLGDEKGKSIFEFLSDNITKRSNVHGSFI